MLKRILLLLFTLSSFLFAAEKAYAWGYGDLMLETLKVVKYVFSVNEFNDVWKVALIISMISALFMMVTPNPDFLKLPKILLLSMGVYTVFVTAKIDIYVDDKADNSNSGLVTDVPWAVGWPLGFFSTLEYRMGAIYETATSIPDGMKYSNSGFFTPLSIFSQSTKHQIVTPHLYQNLSNYIQECVIPDLENGYKDYRTLIYSDNVWAYMGNTSPATFMLYVDSSNNTSLKTCIDSYMFINTELQNYVGVGGVGMEYLGKSLGMLSASAVSSQLGIANQYLLNSSKTASQMLLQNTAINTFSENFRNYATLNGADLNNTAFHSASASSAASAQMIVSGILGTKYIPLIKGILAIVVIGLTPLLMLLMVTPIGFKTLIGYIMMLAWLASWHFGDVILNHIIITKAQGALSGYGDIKFATRGLVDSTTMDYINMASSMYWTIPTIALIIVTGFSLSALASLNNAMTTKLDRTSSAVGGDMGKGNMSFGNVGHNSYSANSVNAAASTVMGNSMRWDDISTFNQGNQSNRMNNVSTQSGTQFINGGLSANQSYNNLMSGMGKELGFNSISGDSQAVGKDMQGNQIYQATGTMSVSGDNVNGNILSGSTYTQDKNGKISLLDASLDVKTKNGESIESTFKGGMEHKRTMVDSVGNKLESTTMENGIDKNFKWTSGQDNGSFVSGIYNAKSNQAGITDGKVNGVDLNKSNSSSTTYSASTANKTANELTDSWSKGFSQSEALDKAKNQSQALKTDASGRVQINTQDQLAGWLFAKGTGVGANAGLGLGLHYSNDGGLSFKTSDGKTENIQLSGSAKSSFESSLSKNMSDEEKISASRDLIPKQLESAINNGLRNGSNIDNTMENIIRQKDSIHTGNLYGVGNGVTSQVQNGPNFNGVQNQNLDINDSQFYKPEHLKNEVTMKKEALKLSNNEEDIVFGSNVSKSIENGKIYDGSDTSKNELNELNKVYNKSKNEGIGNHAMDSLVQKGQNVAIGGHNLADKVLNENPNSRDLIDNLNSTYSANTTKINPDGENTGNWNNLDSKKETSRDLVYKLNDNGAIDYSRFGNSIVRDWNKIENLSKEDISKMIKFDDWDKNTANKLNQIYDSKSDGNFGNQQLNNQVASTPTTQAPNLKSDGNFGFEPGTKGIEETTKIYTPNQNQQKQKIEEVKDKK